MGIPLLPYEPPLDVRTITAKDMMNPKCKTLKLRSKVKDILELLQKTSHNAFPVVDTPLRNNADGTITYGRLRGLMYRHDVITMLYHHIFVEVSLEFNLL